MFIILSIVPFVTKTFLQDGCTQRGLRARVVPVWTRVVGWLERMASVCCIILNMVSLFKPEPYCR